MSTHFTFTSESVTEGHPDKMCDQISDAILDAILDEDPESRVACESMATTGVQPVVENALKHGVAQELGGVRLEIRAAVDAERLRVSVFNDGPQLPQAWSLQRNAGFGLNNVMDRLRYRTPACHLQLGNVEQRGVLAVLDFPGQREASG